MAHFFSTGAVEIFYRFRRWHGVAAPGSAPPATTGDYGGGGDFDAPDSGGDYGGGGDFDAPYGGSSDGSGDYGGGGDFDIPYSSGESEGSSISGQSTAWLYLGSCVLAPDVEASVVHTPVLCDLNAPAPFQKVFNSEQHQVTATLNRVNFANWNFIRNAFNGNGNDIVRAFRTGELVLNHSDCELFLRYDLPHVSDLLKPPAASRGRLYYSAILSDYHESSVNSRVQEISVIFECSPLYFQRDRLFWLFTERNSDLPFLIPE